MTKLEVERFVEEEVKGLWPQWDATDAELRVWMSSLMPFDYGPARVAAQACFREQTINSRRPILGRFLACLRALSPRARGPGAERSDLTTDVFVECYEPPADRPHLAGARRPVYVMPASRQGDREYVRTCAASMAARFDRLYGGHWIVVCIPISQDDGLRGQPARQRAYGRIAAGPDTPGRRFLQNFLAEPNTKPDGDAPVPGAFGWGIQQQELWRLAPTLHDAAHEAYGVTARL